MPETNEFNPHKPEPLLIVISGPSGVGKDTVVLSIKERNLVPFYFVITATTRPIRAGEVEGVDYFFKTQEEFARMIDEDELIEWAHVYNDYKGVPKEQIRKAFAAGTDVIMRLDVQGAETMREKYPEAVLIFLTTRSEAELVERLKSRNTEDQEAFKLRIAMARQELKRIKAFDYIVVNKEGYLDETLEQIKHIIEVEHLKVNHRKVTL